MRRCSRNAVIASVIATGSALAGPTPATPRAPPGSHPDADGALVSGAGLRETVEWFAKELPREGLAADQIGPYRVRGVELVRFVIANEAAAVSAVHVYRIAGKTTISYVLRPAKAPP